MPATHKARAAEIAAILSGIAAAGVVHTRLRWASHWQKFLELFRDQSTQKLGPVRGWEITRHAGTPEGAPQWSEVWQLHYYLGLSDADETEYAFQDHLNAVVRAFRTATLTWGAVPWGLKIVVAEPRAFGDVLCHYAMCELVVELEYDLL